jgi:hypothetical protein
VAVRRSSGPFEFAGLDLKFRDVVKNHLDLELGCFQKSTSFCISCPASENKFCQSPSIFPTNILLVYTIILPHIHMMMFGGGEVVIWSICDVLGWI